MYYSAGLATVTNVNGTLSYLVHDTLGSVSASLTPSGGLQSAQLFAPYGAVRYSTGTMPTSYGFTGQRSDPSGLMYYHARYYDPSVGQFASADAVQGPNRYGYVGGNPETQTDPTGNVTTRMCPDNDCSMFRRTPTTPPGPNSKYDGNVTTTDPSQGTVCDPKCQQDKKDAEAAQKKADDDAVTARRNKEAEELDETAKAQRAVGLLLLDIGSFVGDLIATYAAWLITDAEGVMTGFALAIADGVTLV